jgi:hypothetical protein
MGAIAAQDSKRWTDGMFSALAGKTPNANRSWNGGLVRLGANQPKLEIRAYPGTDVGKSIGKLQPS